MPIQSKPTLKSSLNKYLSSLFLILLLSWGQSQAFDFQMNPATIPLGKIQPGGPSKDEIPSLDNPTFVSADAATFLKSSDRIIGVSIGKEAKAYPLKILNWHEIINDQIDNKRIVVTYCPLCGTGMVFDAQVDRKEIQFGVSGLLYNSDILMFDRQTNSLWSQLKMEGVTGPMAGKKLILMDSVLTTWGDWKARNPNSKVLSIKTGHHRDYDFDPYEGYDKSETLNFPVDPLDSSRHPKDLIYGIFINGQPRAYPFKELAKRSADLTEKWGEKEISISYDSTHQNVRITDSNKIIIPGITSYWFAWKAFYPDSTVYQSR